MLTPPMPVNEAQRLRALVELGLLDTPAEERFDRITRLATRLFGAPIALLSLIDADRQWFKSAQNFAALETPRQISFCAHAILEPDALVVEDATKDKRFADNPLVTGQPNIRFYAGKPLHFADGMPVGTLCLIDQKPRAFSESDLEALSDLAALAESELQRKILGEAHARWMAERDDLLRRASMDSLTRTWNRAAIMDLLSAEVARAERGASLGLAMIDIDHFKAVNDGYGHQAGDQVIVEVATRIRRSIREYHSLGRYGGEELMVVLSNCSDDAILEVCERARRRVAEKPISTLSGPLQVTVSIGSASFSSEIASAEALVAAADKAMYRAKSAGRDRVRSYLAS